ncbi:MAG: FAD:protein FMN transferase [Verrucomicrobiaceae bacterium]|nr:FAD:protein FMN transferase [Verrucomicrobiaceae bacterium]
MVRSSSISVALALLIGSCTPEPTILQGETMGTLYRVTLEGSPPDPHAIHQAVQHRLDELEQCFSNWREDSAVSRWNRSRSTDFQPVPREIAEVVTMALQAARDTDGALDVTIAPLIDLWGFGPGKHDHPPTNEEISAARAHCGWPKLTVQLDPPMLRKSDPMLTINLSTLVEGYASDSIAELVQSMGCDDVLVDVGGAITARGKTWNVGVQTPYESPGQSLSAVPLRNESVTTAGTYRKRIEHEGRQVSHIIDPRTGEPIDHSLVSVSVFASRAVFADAYDTALLVLGPDRGRELAQKLRIKAMFIEEAK